MSAYLLDSNLFRYTHDDNKAYQKAAKEFFAAAN